MAQERRGQQVTRILKLLLCLASRRTGMTVAEMARETKASVRTVYRDLKVLEDLGVPLTNEREGPHTVWHLVERDRFQLGAFFDYEEILALELAERLVARTGPAAWREALRSAVEKARASLPARFAARLEEALEAIEVHPASRPTTEAPPEIVRTIHRAIAEQRPLDIVYHSLGRTTPVRRRVHPLGARVHGGALYFVADDTLTGSLRVFLADRVRVAAVDESSRFERPDDFTVDAFFRDALGVWAGEVHEPVRFLASPTVARLLAERCWHPSQRLTRREDGGAEVVLEVADTPELRRFLLSWGAEVEVLAPARLVAALQAEAERMLHAYAAAGARKGPRRAPQASRAPAQSAPDAKDLGSGRSA